MSLSQSESQVLESLKKMGGKAEASSLAKTLGIPINSVFPLSNLLESKGYVKTTEIIKERIQLTDEGLYCLKNGLPEDRMMTLLSSKIGEASLEDLGHVLKPEEISAAIGWGRRIGAIRIEKRGGASFIVQAKLERSDLGEMLKKIADGPEKNSLTQKELSRALSLVERGLAELQQSKLLMLEKIKDAPEGASANILSADLIKSGKWRDISLRPYDVTASPPLLKVGKKQPYLEFLKEAKEILFDMGFEETVGPYVENEFWNFDVLFQAQDHPARAVHDNFQVKGVNAMIDAPQDLIERVRSAHENGGSTGSKGWGYSWNIETASRRILRTHTTAVSARSLYTHRDPPVKTFCLSKNFRPDVIDSRHMLEFSQLDGILGDHGINVKHLLGVLTEFAHQMGFKEIKFTPGYFPFTEPSIEAYVKHPKHGWIECLGSGLLRPEVTGPLGIKFPVIAWGIGIDRLAMVRLGLDDIRQLHMGNIDSLRQWGWW